MVEIATLVKNKKGTVGNLKNRAELFLAVVESRWQPITPPFKPGATYAERMGGLGEAIVQALSARRATAVGAAPFNVYALKHDAMRERSWR